MNLSHVIDAVTRSPLSDSLARSALHWQADSFGRVRYLPRDWVRSTGDIAWQACVRYRHGLRATATQSDSAEAALVLDRDAFAPTDPYTRELIQYVLLRAMIAAASNDDQFDDQRRMLVLQRICSIDLTTEEKMFLMQEIQRPLSIRQLARYGRTLEASVGLYAASLLTADLSSPSAMLYLTALADALALSPALVAQIHRCADNADDSMPGSRRPQRREHPAAL
ncbi:MAG: DUF533 domain-containing protein [Gammaproteobacteria bacterium]